MASASRNKRRVVNALVTSEVSGVTVEKANELDKVFVQLGKIGGCARFQEKSNVWSYFGQQHAIIA